MQEAVVVALEEAPGRPRLVAYLVAHADRSPSPGAARLLKRALPDYMMPAAFVVLDALPLTRTARWTDGLAAPDRLTPPRDDSHVAPRNPIEERVAEIWAEVLGVPQVGIYDNFFELGGHSLLATRVISQISDAFGRVSPRSASFSGRRPWPTGR